MAKVPSPCIDVCKFHRAGPDGRHCIGCSMTRDQKKVAKAVKGRAPRGAFLRLILRQQAGMGGYAHWAPAYRKRCARKGVTPPLEPGMTPPEEAPT